MINREAWEWYDQEARNQSLKLWTMRLTSQQIQSIRDIAYQIAGECGRVLVFGSRLDDNARVSRLMYGRKVDVIISAPNLKQLPIHDVALMEGRALCIEPQPE